MTDSHDEIEHDLRIFKTRHHWLSLIFSGIVAPLIIGIVVYVAVIVTSSPIEDLQISQQIDTVSKQVANNTESMTVINDSIEAQIGGVSVEIGQFRIDMVERMNLQSDNIQRWIDNHEKRITDLERRSHDSPKNDKE